VSEVALDAASDDEIISYATSRQFAIITKDEDFSVKVLIGKCAIPIVWVRLGNCRNPVLQTAFESTLETLLERLESGEKLIEIYP
jgi:predicted nuclease of predicted toxin-antitoxin system